MTASTAFSPTTPTLLTRRCAMAALGLAMVTSSRAQPEGAVFDGLNGARVRFADVETGRALLSANDDWMRVTGQFQRRALVGGSEPVALEAFQRWNGDAVRAWVPDARARWQRALESLARPFAELRIPLPDDVLLISTNGQESARAPYTRANAVVLPEGLNPGHYSDAMLMAHELWHVASRHAPALASRLYAELGFEPVAELAFPQQWASIRIANPDAPANRHAMLLRIDGRDAWITPVLVASRTALRPGETFFSVAQLRLLQIEPGRDGAPTRALLRDGQPVWHAPDAGHDYLRRLGGNTGYVIHPEEALADNVALLATAQRAPNPELLARLKAVFGARR